MLYLIICDITFMAFGAMVLGYGIKEIVNDMKEKKAQC